MKLSKQYSSNFRFKLNMNCSYFSKQIINIYDLRLMHARSPRPTANGVVKVNRGGPRIRDRESKRGLIINQLLATWADRVLMNIYYSGLELADRKIGKSFFAILRRESEWVMYLVLQNTCERRRGRGDKEGGWRCTKASPGADGNWYCNTN